MNWENLNKLFADYKESYPQSRVYDIAKGLDVPEAALFENGLGLIDSKRLVMNPESFIEGFKSLGTIMSIVRNDAAVHEKTGEYQTVNLHPHPKMATVLGTDIDQRIFYRFWSTAYRFTMQGRDRELEGVAIFDNYGDAVMKLYKKENTDSTAWDKLFSEYDSQDAKPDYTPKTEQNYTYSNEQKDDFISAWDNLKDTHDFYMMLQKFSISRTKALKVAEGKYAYKFHNEIAGDIISRVSSAGMPFMVFVGNKGIIQIHDGIIDKNFRQSGWYNIMDPDFNLHLDISKVAESWHVIKPTVDGDVNSIELYDNRGEQIVTFFSSRKPGTPERAIWREIIDEVTQNQVEKV